MHHSKLLLLPLLAGSLCFSVQAKSCQPDNTNTSITVKSKKFYCTESLDSSGCNAGRSSVRVVIDSSCKEPSEIDLTCTAHYDLKTRKYMDGTQRSVTVTERFELEDGYAKEKVYFTLNSLTDPILKAKISDVSCRIEDGTGYEAPAAASEETQMPQAEVKHAKPVHTQIAPVEPAPAYLPQPETKELVITPAPKPAPQPSAVQSDKQLDLEILKEQNRARELDIKALELKIKLKEMER